MRVRILKGQPVSRRRRRLTVAVAVSVALAVAYDVAADLVGWPLIPVNLHRWITAGSMTALIILTLSRFGAPIVEAWRLGIAAGRREQRAECAEKCGHHCGEDTLEIRMPRRLVAGQPPEQLQRIHGVPRRPAAGDVITLDSRRR